MVEYTIEKAPVQSERSSAQSLQSNLSSLAPFVRYPSGVWRSLLLPVPLRLEICLRGSLAVGGDASGMVGLCVTAQSDSPRPLAAPVLGLLAERAWALVGSLGCRRRMPEAAAAVAAAAGLDIGAAAAAVVVVGIVEGRAASGPAVALMGTGWGR